MRDENEDQGQEPELTRFYRLDHSWSFDGEDHVISVAAYKLHLAGTADSVTGGHPGSVLDDYLSSPGPGTAIAVMELTSVERYQCQDFRYRSVHRKHAAVPTTRTPVRGQACRAL
jgi:hypothetical protein